MEPVAESQWLTPVELSAREKVSQKTLTHWRGRAEGPRWAKFGGRIRYRLSDVIAWENAQFAIPEDAA